MRHPDFYEVFEQGRWKDPVRLGQYLRERGDPARDQVLTPEPAVIHYLSGLRTDWQMYWKPRDRFLTFGPPSPPAIFAELAARRGWRFVVIPADKGTWSDAVIRQMEASGAFQVPPERFGKFVLYERRPGPSGPAAKEK